jgi:hypothetical protein
MADTPVTSFEFIAEWFQRSADVAAKQGRMDSALLWRDGLQHLKHLHAEVKRLTEELSLLRDHLGEGNRHE